MKKLRHTVYRIKHYYDSEEIYYEDKPDYDEIFVCGKPTRKTLLSVMKKNNWTNIDSIEIDKITLYKE